MAKIGLPKRIGKCEKVKEKSVKSQGILKRLFSANPALRVSYFLTDKNNIYRQRYSSLDKQRIWVNTQLK